MDFTVNSKQLKRTSSDIGNVGSSLKKTAANVKTAAGALDTNMESYAILARKINNYGKDIISISRKVNKMQSGLLQIADVYQKTEKSIVGEKQSISKVSGVSTGAAVGLNATSGSISKGLFVAETKKEKKVVLDDKKGDAYIKGEISGSVAVAHIAGEAHNDYSSVSGEVNVLKAAAAGSITATLYKHGKLDPSVKAKVEAKAIGAEGKAEGRLGKEDNNIHGEAKGYLGYAAAEAGLKVDKKGAKIEAGAEAYAAKGTVKAGFTILGIKIDGEIEGKAGGAGIGTKAEATSSKASGYIGAGLGLGLGIKVDIDWSGFRWKGKKGSG